MTGVWQACDMPETDATAFFSDLADTLGTPEPSADEIEAVLKLTKVVAHRHERYLAPVTAYAIGLALAGEAVPAARAARLEAFTRHFANGERDDG